MGEIKFSKERADLYLPDSNTTVSNALERTTHLAIGAHQDDLEIFAYHGIMECYNKNDSWFTGVVVSNGAGSARTGKYANFSDEEMQDVRRDEQRKAGEIGQYSAVIQLDFASSEIKDSQNGDVVKDIKTILDATTPEVLYLHNPADKHETHIGTFCRTIKALREIPKENRPKKVYGCEVWRDLDWLCDDDKVSLNVSAYPKLAEDLLTVFDSQIAGGKRYDLATIGRRLAHATYHSSHSVDECNALTFAIDLTPLIESDDLSIADFVAEKIDTFKEDNLNKYKKLI